MQMASLKTAGNDKFFGLFRQPQINLTQKTRKRDMSKKTLGIHHVTAIAGDPQANVNFYVGVLGLRMVKKTVNFDDPFTYHLYYGNDAGEPGTILTFFPWTSRGLSGSPGPGQLTTTAFSIPANALSYWSARLKKFDVEVKGPFQRFEEEGLSFHDRDGIQLELIATAGDNRTAWQKGPVAPEYAIRGFHSVALSEEGYERTAGLMSTTLGFRHVQESGNRFRFQAGDGGPGTIVDIFCLPDERPGRMGVGAVHHVAWRAQDDADQKNLRAELASLGYNVTPVIDRNYFRSIYFREPGHILFEIATDPPGFAIDEKAEELGLQLKLPAWLESNRAEIERVLPRITIPDRSSGDLA